ncbi:MAG: polymer-forming cytoskeletal protein [Bacteroidales bacterium]|nr:polymer-forming cytoskeletal protein [Bacteroidales bacterium]
MAKYSTATDPQININDISRLSAGSTLKGNFYSETDIRVDGLFEGDIITKGKTVIGESALVRGTIVCAKADVWGKIEGKVFVKDLLDLKSSASIDGEFHFSRLQVEIGAGITGTCSKITDTEFEDRLKPAA